MESDAVPLEDRSKAPGRPSLSAETDAPSHTPLRTADYCSSSDDEDAADGLLARADGAEGAEEKNADLPRRARARTASFSFDFNSRLLQLEASDELSSAERGLIGGRVKEHVSFVGGVALIVGIVIGSGIFSSPGVVAAETGSVGTALLVWAIAGVLSWAGGSSFAELGTALPGNGGHQVYLNAAFGPLAAYCYSFSAVTALKPGSQAIISLMCVRDARFADNVPDDRFS
jgi:hypothetical protein